MLADLLWQLHSSFVDYMYHFFLPRQLKVDRSFYCRITVIGKIFEIGTIFVRERVLSMYLINLESTIPCIKDYGFSVCVFYSAYLPCCQGSTNIKHDTLPSVILHILYLVWLREHCLVFTHLFQPICLLYDLAQVYSISSFSVF